MKKIRFLPVLAAAGLALAVPAASQAQPKGDPEVREARQAYHAALVLQELELSADQRARLKKEIEEARQIRDRAFNDPQVEELRGQYVSALRKATSELEQGGAVSDATQQSLDALEAEMAGLRASHRTMMQSALDEALAVLTAEQQQTLREARGRFGAKGMRGGMQAGRRGGRGAGPGAAAGPRGGRGPGQGGMGGKGQPGLGLLMSDAFYEALSK